MTVDYERIRQENKTEYGTAIGRIGKLFFKDTYADRTHFIFELLQNAEDAIARRSKGEEQSRSVSFELSDECLRVSHFGDPFNEADVRGICGIDESTKDSSLTAIGRFGIGFKSVYAFTDRPEIHSGSEHFAIDSFVWPEVVAPVDRSPDETVFLIPFKSTDNSAYADVANGLRKLAAQTLLFLREINEIKWSIQADDSGHYLRECREVDSSARHVTLVGETNSTETAHEEWLVFSRQVFTKEHVSAGHVEIAFSLDTKGAELWSIQPISESPLVVFFPTSRETRLGFLMQGPYRTTLSRDNIPADEPWNKHLIKETAELLKESLRWLRDKNALDTDVLSCLPLASTSFQMGMFDALFKATRDCLSTEALLPRLGGGYIPASDAILGRGDALRRLFLADQLKALYPSKNSPAWLTSEITTDRAPTLRSYLMNQLEVEEHTPATIVRMFDRVFLEAQSDEWIRELYELLNDIPSLLRPQYAYSDRHQLYNIPLVRMESGRHTVAEVRGQVQAFLPTDITTDFPTVRPTTCNTPEARNFLHALGLREPDPVDDVIQNIIPRYNSLHGLLDEHRYKSDIDRIVSAYTDADSAKQRHRLISELTRTPFVAAVDIGDESRVFEMPTNLYLPTDRLKKLFDGVKGVLFVDHSYDFLSRSEVQNLLGVCGSASRLRPSEFKSGQFRDYPEIKRRYSSRYEYILDRDLSGLDLLLQALPDMDKQDRKLRSSYLWQALVQLAEEDQDSFFGSYCWFYYHDRSETLDAQFVRLLNSAAWIPDSAGSLKNPDTIYFDDLDWEAHAFLQSKIIFRPPATESTAVRALSDLGVEDDVLDELISLPSDVLSDLLRDAVRRNTAANSSGSDHQTNGESDSGKQPAEVPADQTVESFVDHMVDVMTPDPSFAPDSPVWLAPGGSKTVESAVTDTQRSRRTGRSGRHMTKLSRKFVPSGEALEIAKQISEMLHGDYGKRCQICGVSFRTRGGELQVFSSHTVAPAKDLRTNHFGNLLSLCGWHYALIRYGEWVFLDPQTRVPAATGTDLNVLLSIASETTDTDNNPYVPVPVRFWNVYRHWRPDPEHIDEEIRFSIPHWTYLHELLKA